MTGEKTVELRRRFPTESVEGGIALIYASSPIKGIIGYATIDRVKKTPLDTLWRQCSKKACVSKDFFYSYFEGLEQGFSLYLKNPTQLAEPIDIKRLRDEFCISAPQSFRYAPDKVLKCVAL